MNAYTILGELVFQEMKYIPQQLLLYTFFKHVKYK